MSFGERIKQAREERNLTQQDIADKLFVTRQTVSRWEKGDRYPDLLTSKKIADLLELSLDDILSDKELKNVAEKQPVIEDNRINNVVIALFACVVITLTAKIIDAFLRFPFQISYADLPVDYSYIRLLVIGVIATIVRDITFLCGLVFAVRKALSPKRNGIIIMLFFITGCFVGAGSSLLNVNPVEPVRNVIIRTAVLLVPNLIGAISAYLFYFDKKWEKLAGITLITISVISMIIYIWRTGVLYRLSMNLAEDGSGSLSLVSGTDILLNICLCLLFIYQVITLARKRKLAGKG